MNKIQKPVLPLAPLPLAAALLSVSLLFGCGDSNTPKSGANQGSAGPAVPRAAAFDTVAQKGAGFSVGNMMATRVLYVFFDAQCPHCAALWREAKPLAQQVRVVWMPIKLLNDLSAPQGATILSAPNPAAAMDAHEKQREAGGKGLEAAKDLPADEIGRAHV